MTTTATLPSTPLLTALRGVYFLRFAFALVWASILLATMPGPGPLLTVLLVIYPLVDAAAVYWQIHSEGDASAPRVVETINVVVSVVIAIAVGVASTLSIAAALGVWGAWAAVSGLSQLITAVRRRSAGGQIPQMFSGGISVLAGISFLVQASNGADSLTSIGGYAILGGLFFLASAIRLSVVLRPARVPVSAG
ncbi:hypothetical protein CH267_04835 [Rhodococcus sp. 06-621-2]|nr:DUF308 domain-containing protein [Rhodococcus sp. 06-621-2]OZC60274.1 hypothetical protein CH267_04835 [Rhodococcus sp. 06-621-2]